MNVQFQHVISAITGLTGLAILNAIVAGERDPAVLTKLRDPRINLKTAVGDPLSPFRHLAARSYNEISCHR